MVGSLILYRAGSRNTTMERSIKRRREWRARGSAAVGPRVKFAPSLTNTETPAA